MTNMERFEQEYPTQLKIAMEKYLNQYYRTSGTAPDASIAQRADLIAAKVIAAIKQKGIGGVSIDSFGFKYTAKVFGIRNTYKEWEPFLKG